MQKSAVVGIAVYVALAGGVIGGAYAACDAMIGSAPAQTASLGQVKQGPGVVGTRKWTPVEIKREVAQFPPLASYVAPSSAERARAAKNVQRRAVAAAQPIVQRVAYVPAEPAYAPIEAPRSFGPFGFKF